jgi:hypothetical protein
MDQSIKYHYKADFVRKLINEESSVKEFQATFLLRCHLFIFTCLECSEVGNPYMSMERTVAKLKFTGGVSNRW